MRGYLSRPRPRPRQSSHARDLAAPTRPSFANDPPSRFRGRREGRVLAAPMAPVRVKMHGAGTTGTSRTTGLPCAMVYGLLRALPGDRAFLPPSPARREMRLCELGISVGMPGPHGLAVRIRVVRLRANS